MNLDEFKIIWWIIAVFLICIFGIISSFTVKNKSYAKFLLIINSILGVFFAFEFVWLTYHFNYTNSGYSNIAKITLYTCTKDNKTIEQDCEYIGAITYRPYLRELMITTTPLYPILNCPSPNNGCVQEQIFVDKENVKSITALE